ncbi:hypothetical protein B0H14DRAFT_2384776 [Mycena olivaceomarginata]|nr:hypothetical protein B0H14DRAFT_2384776 [Mycena olivaceomarginata]
MFVLVSCIFYPSPSSRVRVELLRFARNEFQFPLQISSQKRFLDHIQATSHFLRVISPVSGKVLAPIGPTMLRRDVEDLKQKHARLMLILFKPWRHASDLRLNGQSWHDAYLSF